jgi:hypothetical protein
VCVNNRLATTPTRRRHVCVCEVSEKWICKNLTIRVRKADGIPIGKPPAGSVELPARILRPTDAVVATGVP